MSDDRHLRYTLLGMDMDAGQHIAGRYDLIERVAAPDGPWESWIATDVKFGERVLLRVSGAADADERLRAAWAARIAHRAAQVKGVVRVLDSGDADGIAFQALDLFAGARPLNLERGSTRERLGRLIDAAVIVAELHRLGVSHRDLAPDRFFVADDGLHLSTFESACCPAEGVAPPLRPPGDRRFAAPERLNVPVAEKAAPPAMDAFALGAMLDVVVSVDPALRPLAELARRATATDAARRPTAAEVVAGLRRAMAPVRTGSVKGLPALPATGFMEWERLRRVAVAFSVDAVVEALGRHPMLLVRKERPLDGRALLLRQCAAVRPSKGDASAGIVVGRSLEVDVPLELPTISSRHLLLASSSAGWTIVDTSSNGTTVADVPLRRGIPRPIQDRDVIGLADHVWLQFLLPSSFAALLAPSAEPVTFEVVETGRG